MTSFGSGFEQFCQLNPAAFLLFCAFSRERWDPAQCHFWNTDFLPVSVGQMQLCQFWGWGVIFVFWLSSTVSTVANGRPPALGALCCSLPLAQLCLGLHSHVPCDCPYYKKLVTLLIFGYWKKSHKVSILKKKKKSSHNFSSSFFVFKGYLKVRELKDIFLGCFLCFRSPSSFSLSRSSRNPSHSVNTHHPCPRDWLFFCALVTQIVCTNFLKLNVCCLSVKPFLPN